MDNHQEDLLDELLSLEEGLSGWEMDFLDNLDKNWRDRELTDNQADKLEQIAKKTGVID